MPVKSRRRPAAVDVSATVGSANVFADLGLPDADELLKKADLTVAIVDAIRRLGLKQRPVAALLGIDQPKVSRLLRGHLDEFSVERLLGFLAALKQDVVIVIRPSTRGDAGRVVVQYQRDATAGRPAKRGVA